MPLCVFKHTGDKFCILYKSYLLLQRIKNDSSIFFNQKLHPLDVVQHLDFYRMIS